MFTALVVDADAESASVLREALADAGCLDIECAASSDLHSFASESAVPDLIVLCARGPQVGTVQRVASALREVPILAVCDEGDIDLAFVAGAAECVTRPLRRRELSGGFARRCGAAARRAAVRTRAQDVGRDRRAPAREAGPRAARVRGCADRRREPPPRARRCSRPSGSAPRASSRRSRVVMIDLDCYHAYNEQYGHLGGDACLQRVADAMVAMPAPAVRFPRALRRRGVHRGAARTPMRSARRSSPSGCARRSRRSRSRTRVGVRARRDDHRRVRRRSRCSPTTRIDLLIAAADSALLRAKAQGRNRVGGEAPLVRPSRDLGAALAALHAGVCDPWFADRIPYVPRQRCTRKRAAARDAA